MILAGTILTLVALSTSFSGVQAQETQEPTGRTITAEALLDGETIVLDGLLNESVWKRAKPGTDFIQQDPNYGGTPTERTEVRFAFDRDNLYMGASLFFFFFFVGALFSFFSPPLPPSSPFPPLFSFSLSSLI